MQCARIIHEGRPIEEVDRQFPGKRQIAGPAPRDGVADFSGGVQIAGESIGGQRQDFLYPHTTMTEIAVRSIEGRLAGRVVQIDIKPVGQFDLDAPQGVFGSRFLTKLVREMSGGNAAPVDVKPLGIAGWTVQQDHILADKIGRVALELGQDFARGDRSRHSPGRIDSDPDSFRPQDRRRRSRFAHNNTR